MLFSTLKYNGIYDFKHCTFCKKSFSVFFKMEILAFLGFWPGEFSIGQNQEIFFVKTLQFQYLYLNSIGRKKIMQPFFNKMAKTQISDTGTHNLNCMGKIPCLIF